MIVTNNYIAMTKIIHRGEDYITVLHKRNEYEVTGAAQRIIEDMLEEEMETIKRIMSAVSKECDAKGIKLEYMIHGKR